MDSSTVARSARPKAWLHPLIFLALAVAAPACGGSLTTNDQRPTNEGNGFSLAERDGRPRVVALERQGDPTGGVAFYLERSSRDPVAHAALGLLLEDRLTRANLGIEVRIDATSIMGSAYATPITASQIASALDAALRRPVTAQEAQGVATRLPKVFSRAPSPLRARVAECRDELFFGSDPKPPAHAALERARALAFSADRVTLGAVGARAILQTFDDRVGQLETWPEVRAEQIEIARGDGRPIVTRAPDLGEREERVTYVAQLGEPTTAVRAARTMGDRGGPFHAKLRAISESATITALSGVATQSGGCLAVEVTYEPAGNDGAERKALDALLFVEAEHQRLAGPDPKLAFAIPARTGDVREAALLAARWHATKGAGRFGGYQLVVDLPPVATDAEVERALGTLEAPGAPRAIAPTRWSTRKEPGQGALWVAFAPQCPPERSTLRGHGEAGLGVLTLAAAATRADDVTIEALDASFGALVAHAEPRAGETPAALATRVGDALARAYYADAPRADDVLAARGEASRWLELSWGREASAVEAFAEALAPAAPDVVEPLGSLEQVRAFDGALADRTTRGFLRRPLAVAALFNLDATAQDAALRAAVETYTRGLPRDACAARPAARSAGKRIELPTRLRGGVAVARLGLLGDADDAFGMRMLGAILTDATARRIGPLANVTVRTRAAGVPLVHVEVRAREEDLAAALEAIDALVARVGRAEITDEALRVALRQASSATTRALADPRSRLGRLLAGAPVEIAELDVAAARAWLKRRAAATAWSSVVAHAE